MIILSSQINGWDIWFELWCTKNLKNLISCPALLFSGIQNSGPEEPDHKMGQTRPDLTRTLDISDILGLPGPCEKDIFFFNSLFSLALIWKCNRELPMAFCKKEAIFRYPQKVSAFGFWGFPQKRPVKHHVFLDLFGLGSGTLRVSKCQTCPALSLLSRELLVLWKKNTFICILISKTYLFSVCYAWKLQTIYKQTGHSKATSTVYYNPTIKFLWLFPSPGLDIK